MTASRPDGALVGAVIADASSDALQSPLLELRKTVDRSTFSAAGDVLTYSLSLTNLGNVTLNGISVLDVSPGSGEFDFADCEALTGSVLAPGEDVSCEATYRVTQSDVAAGRVTNTANATALDPATSAITANSASASSTTLLLAVTGAGAGSSALPRSARHRVRRRPLVATPSDGG